MSASNQKAEDMVAQSVRRSHCARAGREHECVGVCTISPKGIDLACALCGAEDSRNYTTEDFRNVRAIFNAVGVDFNVISGEGQVRAIDTYREIARELRGR